MSLELVGKSGKEVFNRIARYPSFFALDKSGVISEDYKVITAETLVDISETISMLEEGVRQFGDIMGKRPSGLAGERVNPLFESLEFLLITAAETLASRKAEDIAILKSLTEDKGPLLEKLRARHFQRNAADSRLIQDYEFDINSIFVRLIYFIHHLAFGLEGMKPVLN